MNKFFTYKNVKIHYVVFGEGQATLFLHGWGGSVESFKFIAKEFSGKKILIDFPPFGDSGEPLSEWDLYDYVNVTKLIMLELKIDNYNIVAHSFGGRVAIILATCGVVNKMVLTGCAGIKDKSLKLRFKIIKFKIKKCLCKMKLISKQSLLNYGSSDYKECSQTMKATFKNIVNLDLTKYLKQIKARTLLIWGEFDNIVPIKYAKIMNKKIKGSGLYIFKGGTHFAYIEYGVNFIDAVKLFFNL